MISIPQNGFIGWECAFCNACIASNDNGEPVSHYWNSERQEVYCSPECSLKCHQRANEDAKE
jgi:hypothetical protein